jgi:hypothetical protein
MTHAIEAEGLVKRFGSARGRPSARSRSLARRVRGLLLGGPVLDSGLKTLAWAVGFVVVFAPLGVRAYIRRT